MKNLTFCYYLRLDFEKDAVGHQYTFRCTPCTTERQQIEVCEIQIHPESMNSEGKDGFGNVLITGSYLSPHRFLELKVTGRAVTGREQMEERCQEDRLGMFRVQSLYTKPGTELLRFYGQLGLTADMSDLEKGIVIMQKVYGQMQYLPGSTDIQTTAEMALCQRTGVCQDYSHVMLALCRMAGIPCRYVVGMMIGEGESHAWVEVYDQGAFYGLDPTNNQRVFEDYIKISHGRDYDDCRINRGVLGGGGVQQQTTSASVRETGEQVG